MSSAWETIKTATKNRKISDKPFGIATQEAIIVAIISIILAFLARLVVHYIYGKMGDLYTWEFLGGIFVWTGIVSFTVALVIEYSGIQRLTCRSSMKYYNEHLE